MVARPPFGVEGWKGMSVLDTTCMYNISVYQSAHRPRPQPATSMQPGPSSLLTINLALM